MIAGPNPNDVYSAADVDGWTGTSPLQHASGIWGRGRYVEYLGDHIKPGDTVVDLGCGAGLLTSYVCAMVGRNGKVTGLDDSAPLIKATGEFADAFPSLEFALADVSKKLPFADNSVDWFVSFMLLQNMTIGSIQSMFAESTRCLKTNGAMSFLTLHPNFFEEDWDLPFIAYDKDLIAASRVSRAQDIRIEGHLATATGKQKRAFAYPHRERDIFSAIEDCALTLFDNIPLYVDVELAEQRFGKDSTRKFPNGPLFWMASSRKIQSNFPTSKYNKL